MRRDHSRDKSRLNWRYRGSLPGLESPHRRRSLSACGLRCRCLGWTRSAFLRQSCQSRRLHRHRRVAIARWASCSYRPGGALLCLQRRSLWPHPAAGACTARSGRARRRAFPGAGPSILRRTGNGSRAPQDNPKRLRWRRPAPSSTKRRRSLGAHPGIARPSIPMYRKVLALSSSQPGKGRPELSLQIRTPGGQCLIALPCRISSSPMVPPGQYKSIALMLHCDRRYLDLGSADQPCHLYGCPRRLGIRHKLFVDLIHLFDVIEIGDIDRDGDDVCHLKACFFHHLFDSSDSVLRLECDVGAGHLTMRIGPLLACHIERIASDVSIAEGHTPLKPDRAMLREATV